jgi:hypothetical protein
MGLGNPLSIDWPVMSLEGVFPSVMNLEGALALIPPCRPGLATCTRSAATKVPRSPSNGVMKSSFH